MDRNKLINAIIPPDDFQHREGFSNKKIIDSLNENEKNEIEKDILNRLKLKTDMLVIETLAYMRSTAALPLLYAILNHSSDFMEKIIVSASIYSINTDENMIEIASVSFKQITNMYQLIAAFHHLVKFKSDELNKLIEKCTKHNEFLVSHNAKRVLGDNLT